MGTVAVGTDCHLSGRLLSETTQSLTTGNSFLLQTHLKRKDIVFNCVNLLKFKKTNMIYMTISVLKIQILEVS